MSALSVLDLVHDREGETPVEALRDSTDLVRHAKRLGYRRYWVSEHHDMPGIAGAATAVVLAHLAANTRTIRVGSGGIMLPNHSPLQVAEQFGTLAHASVRWSSSRRSDRRPAASGVALVPPRRVPRRRHPSNRA